MNSTRLHLLIMYLLVPSTEAGPLPVSELAFLQALNNAKLLPVLPKQTAFVAQPITRTAADEGKEIISVAGGSLSKNDDDEFARTITRETGQSAVQVLSKRNVAAVEKVYAYVRTVDKIHKGPSVYNLYFDCPSTMKAK